MKQLVLFFLAFFPLAVIAQQGLPHRLAPQEEALIPYYKATRATASTGNITPPTFPVRTMAEWEEIEYLVVTWTQYTTTVREIVRHAVEEVDVIIVCSDSNAVINSLTANGISTARVHFLESNFDSIWIRDYGSNTVYQNEIDSVILVDWIYNRPRPADDAIPDSIAQMLNYPLYATTTAPYDLVHTGGNFHVDGFGTAFSSELLTEENGPGAQYATTVRDKVGVDSVLQRFMGIDRNILMPTLPYDGIHHVDMHLRLLDEETLLVGEYPTGVADGPQIEANLQYILANFNSVYGTPYRVTRIQMPPDANNLYPDAGPWWNTGDYRTYTNNVFVNKMVLVPVYEQQYDTTALRILQEELPGYKVIGIDCNAIIQSGGALHCITRAVGVQEPLLISHQRLRDQLPNTTIPVDALIRHKSGIASATLHYTTDTAQAWIPVAMTSLGADMWTADIPGQMDGTTIYYYVEATANSGKQQVRPMPAPQGFWQFKVQNAVANEVPVNSGINLEKVYPNPAGAITCVPVESAQATTGSLSLFNAFGQEIALLHEGEIPAGSSHYFFHADRLASGVYLVKLETELGGDVARVVVK